jgi:subtilase-type serine protease
MSVFTTASGHAVNTSLQAAWHHELRDTAVHQTAGFAGAPAQRFGTSNTVLAKDSLNLQAGLSYQFRQTMSVNAGVSTTVWKGGGAEFAGSVSVNWKF